MFLRVLANRARFFTFLVNILQTFTRIGTEQNFLLPALFEPDD